MTGLCTFARTLFLSRPSFIKTRDRYDKHETSIRQVDARQHLSDSLTVDETVKDKGLFTYCGAIKVTEDMFKDRPQFVENCPLNYEDTPVVHVKSTCNNTIMTIWDERTSKVIFSSSCGCLGFKNARKGTSVAAQTLGSFIGQQLLKRRIEHIRVVMKGLGTGRLASIKAVSQTGVSIISLTDNTHIELSRGVVNRPKKARRI
ncbi:hypothetical protein GJ496_000386 [Pomphorhynchus laevis]|nr:hypothetical protein GJ496_000386 [Pomphorhynchus laevis]